MAEKDERWFYVEGEVVVSAYTYVKASSAREARKKADGRSVVLAPHGVDRVGANPTTDAIVASADGSFTVDRRSSVLEEEPDAEFLEQDEDDEEDP